MGYREKLKDKLDTMIGDNYRYGTSYYVIDKYEITEHFLKIIANGNELVHLMLDSALDILEEKWILCEDAEAVKQGELAIQKYNLRDSTMDLQKVLIESIEKVRSDKTYIPQAKAITNIANTLLNAFKVNILLQKSVKG